MPRQRYMPQLDGLRFFAVLGVMVLHAWSPRELPWSHALAFEWGRLGVRLFFVLSGFLITGILLDCRVLAEQTSSKPLSLIRQFYVRRFLRIFPIYYLVIFVTLASNLPPARDVWIWFVTYTTNIHITLFDTWDGPFGHFWTLAVEEQFYLVWPWLVLFAPRKWLIPVTGVAIVLAPTYRFYAYHAFPFDVAAMDFKAGTLTLGSMDALGAGALLAMLTRSGIRSDTLQKLLRWLILPTGLVLYVLVLGLYQYGIPLAFFTLADLTSAMIFVWLVSGAALGFAGAAGRLLEVRPLLYLGKISYGLYVYHNFAPLVLGPTLRQLGIVYPVPGFTNFLFSSALTVIVAMLSWHFFELPINNLKRRFEYAPTPALSVSEPALLHMVAKN
jgi:peptidoglycan/LPS O-acetylase OafA/YrhL